MDQTSAGKPPMSTGHLKCAEVLAIPFRGIAGAKVWSGINGSTRRIVSAKRSVLASIMRGRPPIAPLIGP